MNVDLNLSHILSNLEPVLFLLVGIALSFGLIFIKTGGKK